MADERLIDTSELPLERAMLRAAAEEEPPASARRRALAALGLLGVAGAATVPAAVLGAAEAARATTAPLGAALIKWVGGAALVLATVGGAVVGGQQASARTVEQVGLAALRADVPRSGAQRPTAHGAPLGMPTDEGADELAPADPAAAAPPVDGEDATSAAAKARPTTRAGGARGPAVASSTLSDEVRLLDAARAALGRGDVAGAERLLDQYAARHPAGELRSEAAALRGDARAARSAGQR